MQILTQYEREKIEFFLKLRWGPREIGRHLKRDHGVISREIKRNSQDGKYTASAAQKRADFKARKTNKRKLETNEALHDYVEKQLKYGWSPELIAGRLKEQPPPQLNGVTVSHEQIYEYIYEGEGRWDGWWHYLHRARPKRRQRRSRKSQAKTLIKERISIDLRPEVAWRIPLELSVVTCPGAQTCLHPASAKNKKAPESAKGQLQSDVPNFSTEWLRRLGGRSLPKSLRPP